MRTPIINFAATSGDDDDVYEMDTDEIIRLFLVKDPEHFHPELVSAKGFEGTANSLATAYVIADAQQHRGGDGEILFGKINPQYILGEGSSVVNRNYFLIRDEASLSGGGFVDRPLEPIPVRNTLHFAKTTADTWNIIIEYLLVEGGMDMRSEMAELYDDIHQISPQRSAGGIGFQPEDRFVQVGGLGGPST